MYTLKSTNELLQFYGWWQLTVCLFAFLALLIIWYHIGRKQKDFGQVFLALSILCWSLSGGMELIFASRGDHAGHTLHLAGWRSIFSLFNSVFILLALPWFRYLPGKVAPLIRSNYWKYVIGLPFLFALLPTVSKMLLGKNLGLISELDVYYAVLTLTFLGFVLWESFSRRGLKGIAWLAVACIMVTLTAQLFKLTGSEINMMLFSAIFKTCLIMIFFALALSWVKEISERTDLVSDEIQLALFQVRAEGRIEYRVKLNQHSFQLSPSHFALLERLAQRKREGDQWLEIKPRNAQRGRSYDIKDHNEIKRLTQAILDGMYGPGLWTREKHEAPFKNSFFEQGARKIRLAIDPTHIQFTEN